MNETKKTLVVGATGLVGSAVVDQLNCSGQDFVALSRHKPSDIDDVQFIAADLSDRKLCASLFSAFPAGGKSSQRKTKRKRARASFLHRDHPSFRGEIRVESQLTKDATFTFRIPATPASDASNKRENL